MKAKSGRPRGRRAGDKPARRVAKAGPRREYAEMARIDPDFRPAKDALKN